METRILDVEIHRPTTLIKILHLQGPRLLTESKFLPICTGHIVRIVGLSTTYGFLFWTVHYASNRQSLEDDCQHFCEDEVQNEDNNVVKCDEDYCSPFLIGCYSNSGDDLDAFMASFIDK